jgi:O-antigen biosynthesis protein WbqP
VRVFFYNFLKRILDIILVLISAPLTVPLCIVIAISIKLDSPGPAIYWSSRIGRNSKPFAMPKFRSMIIGTPKIGAEDFVEADRYITTVGKFIRKTSLDELPQLLCVLTGEMSLVGPRPLLFIERRILKQRREYGIDRLVPGISGWAQINGRTTVTTDQKVKLDAWYMENRSLMLDIKIIALTIKKVLLRQDIIH